MDFGQADNKDFTETFRTLTGLCELIIADLTLPQSVQQELSHIVPFLKIPIIPIIQKGNKPYLMFRDLTQYPWVIPLIEYKNKAALLEDMQEKIIRPAEEKHMEIEEKKKLLWASGVPH